MIYYFIYILNGISVKEGSFDKDFITAKRNEIADAFNINYNDMPIFTEV